MKEETKYYMSVNSPGIFYKATNINGEYVVTEVKEEIKKNKKKYDRPIKHLTYSIKEVLGQYK